MISESGSVDALLRPPAFAAFGPATTIDHSRVSEAAIYWNCIPVQYRRLTTLFEVPYVSESSLTVLQLRTTKCLVPFTYSCEMALTLLLLSV
jgi:hypothetical protein